MYRQSGADAVAFCIQVCFCSDAGKMIGLPRTFLHEGGEGGGVIQVRCVLLGAGIAQWLSVGLVTRKVPGLSPGRSGEIIFFSRVNFLC